MWSKYLLASLPLFLDPIRSQQIIDLSQVGWTVHNDNISVPASFPSQVHLDLLAAGQIGDPIYGTNDIDQLWVQRSNWTYTSAPIKGLEIGGRSTFLVFDGLDTFVHITLCGKEVANTDNMYRQWYFDVSDAINACTNGVILALEFGSASKIVLDIAKTGDEFVNFANSVKGQEFEGKIYMRKEQNDFGWDWSPSIAPAGPWKSARIVQTNRGDKPEIYVRNALIDIFREGQLNNLPPDQSAPFIFNASMDIVGYLPENASLTLTLSDSNNRTILSSELTGVYSSNETITGSTSIDPSNVELWWPNGMGDQVLYYATISIKSEYGLLAKVERRVGFRTIILNLQPISQEQLSLGVAPGSNWHFEVNGHEFYAKGSNLVPPDVFWPRVNETSMQQLFDVVRSGSFFMNFRRTASWTLLINGQNMNMLRVWSSGTYLPDFIYDLADENGILLWSEFEFGDAVYPADDTFLANYEAEAYYNVRRVNHHPSLALWAGGNELEQVLLAFFFPDSPAVGYYETIQGEVLIKSVYANSHSISYIPSSTYKGYLSLDHTRARPQTPRYNNRTSADEIFSDTDSYDYDYKNAFDLDRYAIGRFANEFGFCSMPSAQSWTEITSPDQLYVESPAVIHRNRHSGGGDTREEESLNGIRQMTGAVETWYPRPDKTESFANFTAWTYSTQVFQADYMASQIAFYRRGSGMRERQLGALYWQLNDLWVAPTWSSIDSQGRTKVLYHAAKDVFSPLIIRPYLNTSTNRLDVYVTSDQWNAISGTAEFAWTDWAGSPINLTGGPSSSSVDFEVGALNTTRVLSYANVSTMFNSTGPSGNNGVATAKDAVLRMTLHSTSGTFSHKSYFHPVPLSAASLRDPKLVLKHTSGSTFTLTATEAVAAWVWLDYDVHKVKGYFVDNGFWMDKGETKEVEFRVFDDWAGDESWVESVSVRSIWDNDN